MNATSLLRAATAAGLLVASAVSGAEPKVSAKAAVEAHEALTQARHALLVHHDVAAAEGHLAHAAELEPGRRDTLIQLAWAAYARRDWPALEARLAALDKHSPRKPKPGKPNGKVAPLDDVADMHAVLTAPDRDAALHAQAAASLLAEGAALFDQGHLQEAAYLFALASANQEDRWQSDAYLARVAVRMGENSDAIVLLERAASRAPAASADVLRAQAARLRGDLAAAAAATQAQALVQKRQLAAASERYWQAWNGAKDHPEFLVGAVATAVAARDSAAVERYLEAAGTTIAPATAAVLAQVLPAPKPAEAK